MSLLRRRGRRNARSDAGEGVRGDLRLFAAGSTDELHLYRRDPLGSNETDLLPPLYEPQLAALGNNAILLRGYELHDGAAFVQEWHCVFG